MSYDEIFASKNTQEARIYTFEFGDQLLFGEALTGAAVGCSVFTGTDPAPMALVDGAAVIVGTTVQQNIIGGVEGVIYNLLCVVNTSSAHTYSKNGQLALVNQATAY